MKHLDLILEVGQLIEKVSKLRFKVFATMKQEAGTLSHSQETGNRKHQKEKTAKLKPQTSGQGGDRFRLLHHGSGWKKTT